ncbi:hypothetical protein ACSSV4_003609 [Roseovarius sp. MBR-154]|jgi:hypothetical protein
MRSAPGNVHRFGARTRPLPKVANHLVPCLCGVDAAPQHWPVTGHGGEFPRDTTKYYIVFRLLASAFCLGFPPFWL